jgi:hypothetical protein
MNVNCAQKQLTITDKLSVNKQTSNPLPISSYEFNSLFYSTPSQKSANSSFSLCNVFQILVKYLADLENLDDIL